MTGIERSSVPTLSRRGSRIEAQRALEPHAPRAAHLARSSSEQFREHVGPDRRAMGLVVLREDASVTTADGTRLAVLIDADNSTASVTKELLEEIAKYGTPTVKRAYGDWTTPHLAGWKDELLHHAIQPVQQFAYTRGKNATDSALIIDAMDLLYAGNLEGFVIVSSDSDFTRLATRLRESGMTVYGIGRRSTPAAFVAACDRFIYLDLLSQEPQQPARPASEDQEPSPPPPNLKQILSTAIGSTSKDDGWSNLGEVGSYLIKSHAAFDPRDYGHTKLGELVRAQSYVDVKDVPGSTGLNQLWVRLKPTAANTARTR
jgi:uncharacterized LabA/DUF88 family protein